MDPMYYQKYIKYKKKYLGLKLNGGNNTLLFEPFFDNNILTYIEKISTGDKLINSFHVNPDDFEVFL